MIKPETIQRIKDTANVVEVLGRFMSLTKKGVNYWACCPFHNEKTPSFSLSPAKNIYYCFGCHEGGDSIKFLMTNQKMSYPEALHYLAEMYNIEIEEEEQSDEAKAYQAERASIFAVNDFAKNYFVEQLNGSDEGKGQGLRFLNDHGVAKEVVERYAVGYISTQVDDFVSHALASGYSREALLAAKLAKEQDDGSLRNCAKGCLTLPIFGNDGKVHSFYFMSVSQQYSGQFKGLANNLAYNFQKAIYGFFQAKKSRSFNDRYYVVSHPLDVLSLHQSGVTNTVMLCTTAFTPEQLHDLKRVTNDVTLAQRSFVLDVDHIGAVLAKGIHLRIVAFPEGTTPDDYARTHGSSQLQQYLEDEELNIVTYAIDKKMATLVADPSKRKEVRADLLRLLAFVPDAIERDAYSEYAASRLGENIQPFTRDLHALLHK